jgi:hypothetical protein
MRAAQLSVHSLKPWDSLRTKGALSALAQYDAALNVEADLQQLPTKGEPLHALLSAEHPLYQPNRRDIAAIPVLLVMIPARNVSFTRIETVRQDYCNLLLASGHSTFGQHRHVSVNV